MCSRKTYRAVYDGDIDMQDGAKLMKDLLKLLYSDDQELRKITEDKLKNFPQDRPEVIWISCSLAIGDLLFTDMRFESRIQVVSSFFDSLWEKSGSCVVPNRIALLAPVCLCISELLVGVFDEDDDAVKNGNLRAIISFLAHVLDVVRVASDSGHCDSTPAQKQRKIDPDAKMCLFGPLEKLLALVMPDKGHYIGILSSTFSLLGNETLLPLSEANFQIPGLVSGTGLRLSDLSGAVAAQLFLLRIGLALQIEIETIDELESWGINTVNELKHIPLIVVLLETLLERETVTSTLGSCKGLVLKKIMYRVMLGDYPFIELTEECSRRHELFYPATVGEHTKVLKKIALMRLIVAYDSVELYWQEGDEGQAIKFENYFAESRLSNQLKRFVIAACDNTLQGTSAKNFLARLKELEQKGTSVFPDGIKKYLPPNFNNQV